MRVGWKSVGLDNGLDLVQLDKVGLSLVWYIGLAIVAGLMTMERLEQALIALFT